MDLELLLTMACSLDKERPAVTGPDGKTLRTGAVAGRRGRRRHVAAPGGRDRVAFCDTNGLAFPVALFGRRRGRAALRGPQLPTGRRAAGRYRRRRRLVVVASGDQAERLGGSALPCLDTAGFVDGALDATPYADAPRLDPDDVALLLYTSGTTAAPKAAVLRHRHLAAYVIGTVEFGSAGRRRRPC